MGVGRRGLGPPWILKFSLKKFFFQFRVGKNEFYHFWLPPSAPLWKNPSDAHGSATIDPEFTTHFCCLKSQLKCIMILFINIHIATLFSESVTGKTAHIPFQNLLGCNLD